MMNKHGILGCLIASEAMKMQMTQGEIEAALGLALRLVNLGKEEKVETKVKAEEKKVENKEEKPKEIVDEKKEVKQEEKQIREDKKEVSEVVTEGCYDKNNAKHKKALINLLMSFGADQANSEHMKIAKKLSEEAHAKVALEDMREWVTQQNVVFENADNDIPW